MPRTGSRKVWVVLLAAGVSLAATAVVYKRSVSSSATSHQQQLISSLQDDLLDNQHEVAELYVSMPQDFIGLFVPSNKVTKVLEGIKVGSDIKESIDDKQYLVALSQAVENTAGFLIKKPVEGDTDVGGLDLLADSKRLYDLLRQQEVLVASLDKLYAVQDPDTRAALSEILNNLNNDQAVLNRVRDKNIGALELERAKNAGQKAVKNTASGIMIVDPADGWKELQGLPEINPDFLWAIRCVNNATASLLAGGPPLGGAPCPRRCATGDPCDRYHDGSYIPAFLNPSNIITVQGTGSPSNPNAKDARAWGQGPDSPPLAASVSSPADTSYSPASPAADSTRANFLNTDIKYVPMQPRKYSGGPFTTLADKYAVYDPTTYSLKQLPLFPDDLRKSNDFYPHIPRGGIAALGMSIRIRNNPRYNYIIDEDTVAAALPTGQYTIQPLADWYAPAYADIYLPGSSEIPISVSPGMVTFVNIPTGQIHVTLRRPSVTSNGYEAMLEDLSGRIICRYLNSSYPVGLSPGKYKVVTGGDNAGKIEVDLRYEGAMVEIQTGKIAEVTLTPAQQ